MQLSACQTCWRRKRSRQNDIESSIRSAMYLIVLLRFIGARNCTYYWVLSIPGQTAPKMTTNIIVAERSVDKRLPPPALGLFTLVDLYSMKLHVFWIKGCISNIQIHSNSVPLCSIFPANALHLHLKALAECTERLVASSAFSVQAHLAVSWLRLEIWSTAKGKLWIRTVQERWIGCVLQ